MCLPTNNKGNEMSLLSKKSPIDSIIAPVAGILKKLEDYAAARSADVSYHKAQADIAAQELRRAKELAEKYAILTK